MREVMAIIRMDMINKTKAALLEADFPAVTAVKVLGRGRKKVDFTLIENLLAGGAIESPVVAEAVSEGHRLVPKRLISIVVQDEEVPKLVDAIITVNQKGHPDDGKIFVLPITDAIRIRTGENDQHAI